MSDNYHNDDCSKWHSLLNMAYFSTDEAEADVIEEISSDSMNESPEPVHESEAAENVANRESVVAVPSFGWPSPY